ncbi:MAG TPA: hypothetical protein VKA30_06925 [Actinomycetota bacterium]|nr:hypothetical protein [Actinomycetota bacterium]
MADEFPVRLGSILFTLVEPHLGHEVDYNRWYERDHFYAGCMVGPGILSGARFVATRPYKELRYPAESPITPDPMTGSYLALYWIERTQQNEWGTWGAKEVHRLHKDGRMFAERDHVHTKMYRYRWGTFRDHDGVPPELALDHRFPGLAVAFVEAADGEDRDVVGAWLGEEFLPPVLAGSAAAMGLQFTPVPIPDDAPADVPRVAEDERRILQLFFLDEDPATAWADRFASLGEGIEATGRAKLIWAGPFIPTVPGTDRYTDQLW